VRMRTPIVLLLIGLMVAGCAFPVVVGSGNLEDRTTTFDELRGVQAGAVFDVEVLLGETAEVMVTADDNLLDHIVVEEVGGILRLGLQDRIQARDATLQAVVTLQRVEELRTSGSATLRAPDVGTAERTTIRTSGASELTAAGLDTGDLDVQSSGSATVTLAGTAGRVALEGSGSARLDLADVRAGDVEVSLSGASLADVTFDGTGAASLSGSSHLTLGGDGDLADHRTSGSSVIERR
jgi:hypothetical protein